jgi:hypothetical protein
MNRPIAARWLAPIGLLWCIALLTNFSFDMFRPMQFGQLFNDMLERLLHGDPTISRNAVDFEVFTRDGHSYTYFGMLPAFLRLPAWLIGRLDGVEYGWLSCSVALAIWIWALMWTVDEVEARMPAPGSPPLLRWLVRIALLFSGPQIFLLSQAIIYNEAVFWASALAAVFNFIAIRATTGAGRPTSLQLIGMAILGGLAVHARASIGVGMCVAVGLLWLRAAPEGIRAPNRLRWSAVVGVLAFFGLAAAALNMARWGSPFRFADYNYYDLLLRTPGGHAVIDNFGEINLSRMGYGFLYYATGTAYFLQFVPAFAGWIAQRYYSIQTPPMAEPLLVPLQLAVAGFGLRRVFRNIALPVGGVLTAALVLIGHLVPAFIILGYYAVVIRYRADFAPLVMFAFFLGYPLVVSALNTRDVRARKRWQVAALAGSLVGVVVSHYTLVLFKITDRSLPMDVREAWVPLAPFAATALSH